MMESRSMSDMEMDMSLTFQDRLYNYFSNSSSLTEVDSQASTKCSQNYQNYNYLPNMRSNQTRAQARPTSLHRSTQENFVITIEEPTRADFRYLNRRIADTNNRVTTFQVKFAKFKSETRQKFQELEEKIENNQRQNSLNFKKLEGKIQRLQDWMDQKMENCQKETTQNMKKLCSDFLNQIKKLREELVSHKQIHIIQRPMRSTTSLNLFENNEERFRKQNKINIQKIISFVKLDESAKQRLNNFKKYCLRWEKRFCVEAKAFAKNIYKIYKSRQKVLSVLKFLFFLQVMRKCEYQTCEELQFAIQSAILGSQRYIDYYKSKDKHAKIYDVRNVKKQISYISNDFKEQAIKFDFVKCVTEVAETYEICIHDVTGMEMVMQSLIVLFVSSQAPLYLCNMIISGIILAYCKKTNHPAYDNVSKKVINKVNKDYVMNLLDFLQRSDKVLLE